MFAPVGGKSTAPAVAPVVFFYIALYIVIKALNILEAIRMKEKKSVKQLRAERERYLERVRVECRKSRQKKIDAGLLNISVWVPAAQKEKIKAGCRQLCERHLKKGEVKS